MAAGKPIGDFSFKATAFTFTPGPTASVLGQMHCEGNATDLALSSARSLR